MTVRTSRPVGPRPSRAAQHLEAAQWAAVGLGAPLVETPGAHGPQLTHPRELAALVRPLLARLGSSASARA